MLTRDALFNGRLVLCQQREGYRFSIDAVLLAGLTRIREEDRVIDLGTGCGVVPIILAYRRLGRTLTGLEIQPELVELARTNVAENGFSEKIRIDVGDIRDLHLRYKAESFDLVVSNPPYRKLETGRVNPGTQRAVARHELRCSLRDVLKAAARLLPTGGRLVLVYPATRLGHLLAEAPGQGFSPKALTVIYPDVHSPARLVHVECRKHGGEELRVNPAFFIFSTAGEYTREMQALYH